MITGRRVRLTRRPGWRAIVRLDSLAGPFEKPQ